MSLESESVMTVERSSTTDEQQETANERIERLRQARDVLVGRLLVGEAKIREANTHGRDLATVRRWEDGWIELLHQYEIICNELDEIGVQEL